MVEVLIEIDVENPIAERALLFGDGVEPLLQAVLDEIGGSCNIAERVAPVRIDPVDGAEAPAGVEDHVLGMEIAVTLAERLVAMDVREENGFPVSTHGFEVLDSCPDPASQDGRSTPEAL